MKLYEIEKGSKIKLPITDGESQSMELCTFNNIDGMYSNITTKKGDTVHLLNTASLKWIDGHYELDED